MNARHSNRRNRRTSANATLAGAVSRSLEFLEPRRLLSGSVSFTVANDLNGDGNRQAGEPGLAGWTVYVDLNRSETLDAGEVSGVTATNGTVTLDGIAKGTWDVRQVMQSGWTPAPHNDVVERLQVKDNETTSALFMNVQIGSATGTVTGTVRNDVNGDGILQADDPGLSGWTVFLDLNDDRFPEAGEPSAVTDATGTYTISNVTPGRYRLREVMQPNWDTSTGFDAGHNIDVTAGRTTTSNFVNFNTASIGTIVGTVWNDVHADGVRNAGDPGLDNWTVFLDTNANNALDAGETSTVTDLGGNFTFQSIPVGTYRVAEVMQDGWQISPGSTQSVTITLAGTEAPATVTFGNFTPTTGSVSGTVYNDADGNGFRGAGEAGIEGWTVFLDADNNGALDAGESSATTLADGSYTIGDVPVGSFTVREVAPVGWKATAPGTGAQLVTLLNGDNKTNINFGNQQRTDSSIRGTAYFDANKNHTRDAGERGLAGITVWLDTNDNGALDVGEPQTVTSADLFYTPGIDEAGTYSFTHLPGGTYHVRETVSALLSATLDGDRSRTINLLPGEDRTNVNFANRFRGNEIHGHKYNDLNRNHKRDAGVPGIGGVTIYLDTDRDNILDAGEPRTQTAADGSYEFITNLAPGAYVVREVSPKGWTQTYPTTTGGTLWPTGTSNPAVGNVSPTSITASLAQGETLHQNVSLTLPASGPLTNKIDVFLLFDDTGSFTANSPIVRAAFPQIISALQAALPTADLAFGVGRFEEYGNFALENPDGRPFILNQPIISADTPGFATSIQAALDRTAPGYGGDTPETDIEALYQTATGAGFDGNNNGTTTDSGAAGQVSTQLTPGASGDVPSFGSFTVDPAGNVLPASGGIGGAGFRPGALPIILTATDTGFAFQPKGETSITGAGGLTLPLSALTQTSRSTTPFNSGAGVQETITALNALGALVVGLGTVGTPTLDPRQSLEGLAKLTGAINHSLTTIPNGTADPIAPGDPLYFQISSGFGASVANGIVTAIQNAVTTVNVNVTLKASDPRVHITNVPDVINNLGAGDTATFDVGFTGDGRPHRFDLQFVRAGSDVVLGSIPVVLGTPIVGDGYEYEDLDDGQIDDTVDFGNIQESLPLNVTGNFAYETAQTITLDFDQFVADSLSIDDVQVVDMASGNSVALKSLAYDADTNRATLSFDAPILANGNYQLRIASGAVTNLNAPISYDFFVLAGDANRDRHVDAADQAILDANLGSAGTFDQGDFNYDGTVDSADAAILSGAMHLWLPPQGAVALPSTDGNDAYRVRLNSADGTVEVMRDTDAMPTYRIPLGAITDLSFVGGSGNDSLTLLGTSGADAATFSASSAQLGSLTINHSGVESIAFDGAGGFDDVIVNAAATVAFPTTQRLNSLTITDGSLIAAASGSSGLTLVTRSLSITGIGSLDLGTSSMIVDYADASPLSSVESWIHAARANGAWTGSGITSTAARNNPQHNTTLGAMEPTDSSASTTFAGEPLDGTAVLVKYTYNGDANFDGRVTFDDYTRIDTGFNQRRTGWANGDFNLDGTVNFDDYVLIDTAFNSQGAVLGRPSTTTTTSTKTGAITGVPAKGGAPAVRAR